MLPTRLSELSDQVAPVTPANEHILAVPASLAPLFPAGGLQQGWSVGVVGHGGWSLAMALVGAALGRDGWVAGVGLEELGLVAADELGLRLDRVVMVETPGRQQWPTVVAALIEAFDIICLGPADAIGHKQASRLSARARELKTVLFHLDGGRSWPQALDAVLTVSPQHWSGLGEGHGHLQSRQVTVEVTGRRSMAKARRVDLLLPGPDGVELAIARSDSTVESHAEGSACPVFV